MQVWSMPNSLDWVGNEIRNEVVKRSETRDKYWEWRRALKDYVTFAKKAEPDVLTSVRGQLERHFKACDAIGDTSLRDHGAIITTIEDCERDAERKANVVSEGC